MRMIFDWYVNGDADSKSLSLLAVAKKLSELQIPTFYDLIGRKKPTSGYGVWHPATVGYILGNTAYIGKWAYGKTTRVTERVRELPDGRRALVAVESRDDMPRERWIEVDVPAILEGEDGRALFAAAQERLAYNKRNAARNCKRTYLLRGMLTCECGATMAGTPAPQGGYAYYHCMRKQWEKSNAGRDRCKARMVRADWADVAVWQEIEGKLLDAENLIEGLRERQADAERAIGPLKDQLRWAEDRLAQCDARIKRAMDLYLDGRYPKDWLDEQVDKERRGKADLERTRHDLAGRIEAGRISDEDIATVERFRADVLEGIAGATPVNKRRLLEILRVQCRIVEVDGERKIVGSWLIPGDEIIANVTNPRRSARCLWSASSRR
ncbi:MAG: hypothetical protein FJ011_27145 [Chloroflexi bacterium]|nr:hypothetical protein [Chloroflexota bacterium]